MNSFIRLQIGLVNHCVSQNEAGDAAYLKALEVAREMLPNGPLGINMAKNAINKGTEVSFYRFTLIMFFLIIGKK